MRRREFITLLGGALISRPILANAQPAARMRTVGVLMGLTDDAETQGRLMAFEQGLEREGWSLGQDLRIEYRYAEGDAARMQAFEKGFGGMKTYSCGGHRRHVGQAWVAPTPPIAMMFVLVYV